jgi:hypothetical protein
MIFAAITLLGAARLAVVSAKAGLSLKTVRGTVRLRIVIKIVHMG